MIEQNVFSRIEEKMPRLSHGQKKIGSFVLSQYDKAAYMTAGKIGEKVGVSESTVVRFATALGYSGFPALQQALQEGVGAKLTSLQRIDLADDRISSDHVLDYILTSDIERIRTAIEQIDHNAFDRAVDAIAGGEHIYISGMRSAALLSGFLGYYLGLMFPNVHTISATSTEEMFEQMIRITERDVFVGISFPRYSKRIINAMNFASSNGAATIAITDCEQSPIAHGANYLLMVRNDMASFVDSYVAPLSVINALLVATSRKRKADVSEVLTRLEAVWDEYDVYAGNNRKT